MSFRKEEKIQTNFYQQKVLLNEIKNLGAKQIYNERSISSIYFDNKYYEMFNDSEEGILPRKKIRIRFYNNDYNNYFFEKKISSYEGKFKISNKLETNIYKRLLKEGYLDEKYGICYPLLKISYMRNYYKLNNLRFTFDKNIVYQTLDKRLKISDETGVVELKSDNEKEITKIDKIIPLARKRFSKFSRAFNYLNIQ
tara:strand:+ start:649 stop:1239 length:591 start_codon:yes stop_codon:yes gene_type:complete